MRNDWELVLVLVVSTGPLVRAGCTNDDDNDNIDGSGGDEFDLCLLEEDAADIFESKLEQDCSTGKGLRFCLECDCESTLTCAVPCALTCALTVPCAVTDFCSL